MRAFAIAFGLCFAALTLECFTSKAHAKSASITSVHVFWIDRDVMVKRLFLPSAVADPRNVGPGSGFREVRDRKAVEKLSAALPKTWLSENRKPAAKYSGERLDTRIVYKFRRAAGGSYDLAVSKTLNAQWLNMPGAPPSKAQLQMLLSALPASERAKYLTPKK